MRHAEVRGADTPQKRRLSESGDIRRAGGVPEEDAGRQETGEAGSMHRGETRAHTDARVGPRANEEGVEAAVRATSTPEGWFFGG
ncbi:hypothetical protein GCM10027056_01670 [Glaciibacter psychrotolerans]